MQRQKVSKLVLLVVGIICSTHPMYQATQNAHTPYVKTYTQDATEQPNPRAQQELDARVQAFKASGQKLADTVNKQGNTLLHVLVQEADIASVRAIIEYLTVQGRLAEIDVQVQPQEPYMRNSAYMGCYTPLHVAMRLPRSEDKYQLVQLLLNAGAHLHKAKLTLCSTVDHTPYVTAQHQKHHTTGIWQRIHDGPRAPQSPPPISVPKTSKPVLTVQGSLLGKLVPVLVGVWAATKAYKLLRKFAAPRSSPTPG